MAISLDGSVISCENICWETIVFPYEVGGLLWGQTTGLDEPGHQQGTSYVLNKRMKWNEKKCVTDIAGKN